jgi:signal transduction histidine kinase
MSEKSFSPERDRAGIDELRARLAEAEDTLRAIRHGEIDALLVMDAAGERVYTLRSADAPYRALVEQMQGGAVTVTSDGAIIYCNRYFGELIDVPLHQVIGVPIGQFVELPDQPTLMGLIAKGAGTLRTRLRRGTGPVDVNISVSTVTVDDVEHRTLIVTDLSKLTQVQRESQSKDEFLAMLAHELRNPLGAIRGAVQVLELTALNEARAEQAREVIQRQVLNMVRMVDDLLDVGRVVTGKIVLEKQIVDLAEMVRTCVTAMISTQNVERLLEVALEPVWVHADRVRLEQIVSNLVSNAIKFTPPDRLVRLSVSAEGPDAVFRVSDDGAGIDSAVLPHIFDLFVQAEVAKDRPTGGLGIGLTLARRLAALHGGTIVAESAGLGRGSTFTLRLAAAFPTATATVSSSSSNTPGRARSVLLVEDHADAREMYGLVLEADGHEVHKAEDGAAALDVFDRVRPQVAIVDIGLPGMDGYELARRIRSAPGGDEVTLIALTGYGFPDDRKRSAAAGFDRHLVKPVAPNDLRQALGLYG